MIELDVLQKEHDEHLPHWLTPAASGHPDTLEYRAEQRRRIYKKQLMDKMKARAVLSVVRDFDPSEARNEGGEWTSGGASHHVHVNVEGNEHEASAPTQLSWENTPGITAKNHMPEMHSADIEKRREFHRSMQKVLLDDKGNDIIAQRMGIHTIGSFEGAGIFEGRANPGSQSQVSSDDEALLNASEAVRGALLRQDAAAWHKPNFEASSTAKPEDMNMLDFRLGRTLTETEAEDVTKAMSGVGGGFFSPIASPTGFRVLNVPDYSGVSNVDFKANLVKAIEAADLKGLPDTLDMHVARSDSGYITNNWTESPNGEDYRKTIAGTGRPDVEGKANELFAELGPKVAGVEDEYAEKYGWTPDIKTRFWRNLSDKIKDACGCVKCAMEYVFNRFISVKDDFEESKHPRGQPTNKGEFAKSSSPAVATGKVAPAKPTAPPPSEGKAGASTKVMGKAFVAQQAKVTDPDNPGQISPRLIGTVAKNLHPDDLAETYHDTDYKSFFRDPDKLKANAAILRSYNVLPINVAAKKPADVVEAFVSQCKDNLKWVYDHTGEEGRDRSASWYFGARHIVDVWSKKYGLKDTQVAGVLAALSPQTDWNMNVSQAERILDIENGAFKTKKFDDKMTEAFKNLGCYQIALDKAKKGNSESLDQLNAKLKSLVGKKGVDLPLDTDLAYYWIRAFDEGNPANNGYRLATPEGRFVGKQLKGDGTPFKMSWGTAGRVIDSLSIIKGDGDPTSISKMFGKNKVRSFYNNMLAPNSKKDAVTVDTHAVAAAMLMPLSGTDIQVSQNFGTSNVKGSVGFKANKPSGVVGFYPLYVEAYRRAAKEVGVQPNQLQSITWESMRNSFAPIKDEKGKADIAGYWKDYSMGKASIDDTRNKILTRLGGQLVVAGYGHGDGDDPADGAASYG
jgi:hypothetical protein